MFFCVISGVFWVSGLMVRLSLLARVGIFLAVLLLPGAFGGHEEASINPKSNMEAVCSSFVRSASFWGEKLQSYQPTCNRNMRGIGPTILSATHLMESYAQFSEKGCYDSISDNLCKVQFETYEPSVTCEDTKTLVFDLIKTCDGYGPLSSGYSSCPTYTASTQLIDDPKVFCESGFVKEDVGEGKDGFSASQNYRSFNDTQKKDCEKVAMDYNVCMLVGVNKLAYPREFCLGKGFSAYCQAYPTRVTDFTFLSICSNAVVPFFVEDNMRQSSRKSQNVADPDAYCSGIYEKILLYLGARKGEVLRKARAAKSSLESTARVVDLFNEYKKSLLDFQAAEAEVESQIDSAADELQSYSTLIASNGFGISQAAYEAYNSVIEDINTAESISSAFQNPPSLTPEGTISYDTMHSYVKPIADVIAVQRRLADNVKKLSALMADPLLNVGYVSTGAFYQINTADLENVRSSVHNMWKQNSAWREQYDTSLDAYPNQVTAGDAVFIKQGTYNTRLAGLYDAQLQIVLGLQKNSASGSSVNEAAALLPSD